MNARLPFGTAPLDLDQACEIARQALTDGNEDLALALLQRVALQYRNDARLWQWKALLLRALDRYPEALDAIALAARAAPLDPSIAHGQAQITYEAGGDAVDLFLRARRLGPESGAVRLGVAAARLATGDFKRALGELDGELIRRPRWVAGHQQMAQIRWMLNDHDGFVASFERALESVPGDEQLWGAYLVALIHAKAYDRVGQAIKRARHYLATSRTLDANEAVMHSETGNRALADTLFAALDPITEPVVAIQHVRHLLRSGLIDQAKYLVSRWLKSRDNRLFWPYASIIWRLTDDLGYRWLDQQPGLVSVHDLADRLPPLDRLAQTLRSLHRAKGQHLDQSVRGGTQTDGILFANVHPDIAAVREVVTDAVSQHIAQLPPPDPHHPTLAPRRDRAPRFAGSWSVRLSGAGHHANHVHSAGWLSSALYVALPEAAPAASDPHAGWLTLGEPDTSLGLDLPPVRLIEPKPGRLVLFPSTMWHGTRPFDRGERLTIAFDVAHPAP